ncbi:oligopeptide ABC transporter substrate-binding protein [Enterococcus hirae]|uniref:oligopeptide ABC transporter substrate-binding protein n=1 Tax=Enterococcus hirae TaxID=1354 RepID=UPI000F6EA7D4|nr:oligopeptide ABC transporter substrate-binding protein [Enterococcus hirae]MBA5271157.1 oligopeptide ABC transporter substrate-binding protein [Enterococcus hirae]MDU4894603.1 oligopeptide ABC transporter substrate-binding protein [Enterococcus hirae]NVL98741.1 oligopeptide ABC transporter substrate-binding protein [Enterococcus hirae]VEE84515.1 peptide ABC transporter peptide-binding protein [Enterococcus hirae]
MKKSILGVVTLFSVMALAACGSGGGSNSSGSSANNGEKKELTFPISTKNDKDAIKDGELEAAVATDSQFKGLFQWEFYQDSYDAAFMAPSHEALFTNDADFKITNDGAASLDLDQETKKATIKVKDNVKWSDGKDVTADDVIFPYEIIGNKDYTGIRYDDNFRNIVGMEEYHSGSAPTISGIKKVDNKTVEIEYKKVEPSMLQSGGGIWAYAAPKHTLEGVAIKDMESSDQVRKNPVTFGPYYMSNIVAGESVEYLPNEYYWNGKPQLKKITMKSLPIASATEALNSKLYDMIFQMPTDTYDTYKDVSGYTNLGREQTSYTYLGFKLGKWNAEKSSVEYDPNSKMADKSLRQAMGYALDNDAVGERFYAGLRSNATSLIPPVFESFHDDDLKGFTQDIDKANKLLDDAGYKDVDGDGLREDKDGNKLTINFASMSGGETAQPLSDYYVQQWKKIGLDVKYTTGRLIEFNSFYDKLENDDPEIDVYQAAWSTGTDPNPNGLWGPNAAFNYTRFESEENTKLINDINSSEAFDAEYQKEAYKKWQAYAFEEAFAIPTLFRNEVLPVSDRTKDWDWSYDAPNPWAKVTVTAESRS